MAFLDGMARTATNETTPALVARGVFAMNLIAGGIDIGGNPCPQGPETLLTRADEVIE
jgi:hypothetical protein